MKILNNIKTESAQARKKPKSYGIQKKKRSTVVTRAKFSWILYILSHFCNITIIKRELCRFFLFYRTYTQNQKLFFLMQFYLMVFVLLPLPYYHSVADHVMLSLNQLHSKITINKSKIIVVYVYQLVFLRYRLMQYVYILHLCYEWWTLFQTSIFFWQR